MRGKVVGGPVRNLIIGIITVLTTGCGPGFRSGKVAFSDNKRSSSCNPGYNLQTGACVANICAPNAQQSCQTGNGTGSQACNSSGTAWGACGGLTSCNSGYNLQNGICQQGSALVDLPDPILIPGQFSATIDQNGF